MSTEGKRTTAKAAGNCCVRKCLESKSYLEKKGRLQPLLLLLWRRERERDREREPKERGRGRQGEGGKEGSRNEGAKQAVVARLISSLERIPHPCITREEEGCFRRRRRRTAATAAAGGGGRQRRDDVRGTRVAMQQLIGGSTTRVSLPSSRVTRRTREQRQRFCLCNWSPREVPPLGCERQSALQHAS